MAEAIRDDPTIKGISVKVKDGKNEEFLMGQFADDTTAMLQHYRMTGQCINIVSKFESAAGSKLNLIKTKGLMFRNDLPENEHVNYTVGPEVVLGYKFGERSNDINSWKKMIDKLKSCMTVWKTRNLSYKGKVHVIRSYVISNLLYFVEARTPPKVVIDQVEKFMWDFLWDGKTKGKVNREICKLPVKQGGLNMPDITNSYKQEEFPLQ